MDLPGEGGVSQREKLEHVWDTTGRKPEGLEHPPIPEAAEDAWTDWLDLHAGRSQGFGPAALSWLDLDAWCRVRRRSLTRTALDLIRTIDRAYLEAQKPEGSK